MNNSTKHMYKSLRYSYEKVSAYLFFDVAHVDIWDNPSLQFQSKSYHFKVIAPILLKHVADPSTLPQHFRREFDQYEWQIKASKILGIVTGIIKSKDL